MRKIALLNVVSAITLCMCVSVVRTENGEMLSYTLDTDTGVLTIKGSGNMDDYTKDNPPPWYSQSYRVLSVVFDGDITSIGNYGLYDLYRATSIILPSTITSIRDSAFEYCESLASITIPKSVTSISFMNVFYGCTNLSAITVEDGNPRYKDIDGVLYDQNDGEGVVLMACPATKRGIVEIPDDVRKIATNAFLFCKYLASVKIPEGVSWIGNYAFQRCSNLTTVQIPASVTTIGVAPFLSCSRLVGIDVDENNPNYKSEDGVLFNKYGTELIQYPNGKKDLHYEVPDGVTTIREFAFQNSTLLTSVAIPNAGEIQTHAFFRCLKLEIVSYTKWRVPICGTSVFDSCDSLRLINVHNNYGEDHFCGMSNITCRSDSPGVLSDAIENHCFQAVCDHGIWTTMKRSNATELENDFKSNGCVEYRCDNLTGDVASFSKCTNSSRNACINNYCAETQSDKPVAVNISIESKDFEELDMDTIIQAIRDISGLKYEQIEVEVEMDKKGHVLNVIIYVDDGESAQVLVDAVNRIAHGEGCQYGVLCRSKKVVVLEMPQLLSQTAPLSEGLHLMICLMVLLIMIVMA